MRGLVWLALAAAPILAAAQEPVHAYRPGVDVLHYDFALDLPDSGHVIQAQAGILVRRTASIDTLRLDLVGLHVDSVAVNGRPVVFGRTPDEIAIPLPRGAHDTLHVTVRYDGAPTDGLIIRTDSAGRWTAFGDNWPNRARFWLPTVDDPSDKATVTWTVRAPSARTVVGNGRLAEHRAIDGGRTLTRWVETRPVPTYVMVIAAAPLFRYDLGKTACGHAIGQQCVPQAVYVAPEQRNVLPGAFADAPAIVTWYSTLVGPFPYEKLAHLQSSTRYGGMENATEIFYSDAIVRSGHMTDALIAHETAHQWFGDGVTERRWSNLWLSEGFATYFAALWTEHAQGEAAFRQTMAGMRDAVLHDTKMVPTRPVIDTITKNPMYLLDRNSYQKGGFVLHMLRRQVGDTAFFRGLRAYEAAHRNGTALTRDLRAAVETASGQSLGWFFDQWLRRPGYPELQVHWRWDAGSHRVIATIDQGARFGAYRFPLTMQITDASGHAHRTRIDVPASTHVVRTLDVPLAAPPQAVVVDPDVDLLAAISSTGP